MQKTILAVSALAALACLSAFALLEQTTSPANTQALADTARFIAENKFITGEQYLTISNVEAHPNDDRLQLAFDVAYRALRPHRACHFISWIDGLAFADWAGLRHMTELEFEKAARGPEPVVYREYVWAINEHGENRDKVVFTSTILQADGTPAVHENGSERVDGNLHVTMFHYKDAADVCPREPDYVGCRQLQGGDGGLGPVRVGVYGAASGGDRVHAGASYYGVMELGGNLQEPVVTVGHPYGRQFKGTHGDGTLTPDGRATNADWQAIDGEYAFGGRGGSWRFSWNHARTSDRFKGLRTKANRRAAHIGFRGVRTAFSTSFE